MAHPTGLEERIAALEAVVRDLTERMERLRSHLAVAQDEQVARVLARHPDLREHLPRLD